MVFAGVVNTTIRGPVTLGRSTTATTVTYTFVTPASHLAIRRTEKTRNTELAPAGQSGSTCYFTASSTGVYTVVGSQSTGKFAGATGGDTYVTTVVVGADLQPGRTTCGVSNAGTVIAKGTSITYRASGPLTVKQLVAESASTGIVTGLLEWAARTGRPRWAHRGRGRRGCLRR